MLQCISLNNPKEYAINLGDTMAEVNRKTQLRNAFENFEMAKSDFTLNVCIVSIVTRQNSSFLQHNYSSWLLDRLWSLSGHKKLGHFACCSIHTNEGVRLSAKSVKIAFFSRYFNTLLTTLLHFLFKMFFHCHWPT